MKLKSLSLLFGIICLLGVTLRAGATVYYVNVNNAVPVPPYTNWATAATNIQDAVNITTNGDTVLVTNGVYAYGGLSVEGIITNRVASTNAITVQSVNGPWVTTILGAGATNGPGAVRCAWLTNGASLVGFTLTGGATRTSGTYATLESGGGVWCASSNAYVVNCLIISNNAFQYGAGAYQGNVKGCLISGNGLPSTFGGASYQSVLNNCTIVSNATYGVNNPWAMTNCIIYFNNSSGLNWTASGNAYSHCCTTPSLSGTGNFTTAPLLFADGVHLANNSPCIGAGVNPVSGTNIFGNTWANPPSVGCAEWEPSPLVSQPQIKLTGNPVGFTVGNLMISGSSAGEKFAWLQNGSPLQDNGQFSGSQTTNLTAIGVSFADAGSYQLVVSNSFGMATSSVAPLVIHCVDINGANPVAPYLTWSTAATNIQDAITAASAGDVVLVTNGLYATGGKSMDGVITNRVSVDKAILVQSVSGPNMTVIQGAWDPTSTNGPAAVRCTWLTNSAIMSGFTIQGGATRSVTAPLNLSMDGGGVCGSSTNAMVCNCVIAANTASHFGGGTYKVSLINCTLTGNQAAFYGGGAESCSLINCFLTSNSTSQSPSGSDGGGADNCSLENCALTKNSAWMNGGAANGGTLVNCTVTANTASGYSSGYGAAVYGAVLTNCIVFGNFSRTSYPNTNYASCTMACCCADPLPAGTGNIDVNPQILGDGVHLAATSPCIGAGNNSVISGTDIDGQPWNNPPAIGCDEWHSTPLLGLGTPLTYQVNSPAHGLTFNIVAAGQTPFTFCWSKDGVPITDDGHHVNSGTAVMVVNNFGPNDGGSYQVVVSNAFGMVTSPVVQVVIHAVNVTGASPVAPYSTWATAATNIQDAVNAAAPGDIVLVTNGIYASGGVVMAGALTNRVAVNQPITVMSVNGWQATVIQGAWDPVSINGPGAVRCAWLGNGAKLAGFTLENGATLGSGDALSLQSGGGAWCVSSNATILNCVLTNNEAGYGGGGVAYGVVMNSLIVGNAAGFSGGGALYSVLNNCTVENNFVYENSGGAGTWGTLVQNSIVLYNNDLIHFGSVQIPNTDNFGSPQNPPYLYSCSYAVVMPPFSMGDVVTSDARFLDLYHLSTVSPCYGTGSAAYASGYDLDGQLWNNPPSMGCSEIVPANLIGPLTIGLYPSPTNVLVYRSCPYTATITGRAANVDWSFGDGPVYTNYGYGSAHEWTNAGNYTVTATVFNHDNPAGVSASLLVHVQPLNPPQILAAGIVAGAFQFQFPAQTNANYTIQYTTNLAPPVAWNTLQTIYYSSGGTIQINDSGWTNSARFYQVLVQ